MDAYSIRIEGERVGEIIDMVEGDFKFQPSANVYVYYSEKYYLRNDSNLLSSFIIKLQGDNICIIDIIAGGGGTGLFGFTLGAETSRVNEVIRYFEAICKEKGWSIEADLKNLREE
ncbi:hypothetical protein [Alkaliphilus serpentinus]|uniref:Uncharacterized protein n=1 Tax=Alkaliphilus serpentinus TaxID=1482731 RepID=A0A833HMB3_9FIRM|nr:hypothetical protein [Alkaliphilus serpentinus]KAB3527599.1 hypothetical protein F8153_11485 [Alkaliphilus serpentinus]